LTSSDEEIAKWFTKDEGKNIKLRKQLTETEKLKGMRLLYTWRDRFCNDVRELPVTDLIKHRIPTIKCNPVRSKPKLYTQKEAEWQKKHLPELLDAGIIDWVNSAWSVSCKFPVKKNGDLRMVHIYCPINHATIKTNYPIKRTEPIINAMSMPWFKLYWWADGELEWLLGDSDVPAPRLQDSLQLDPWTVCLSKDGTRLDGSASYVCAVERLGNGPDPRTKGRTALNWRDKGICFHDLL